MTFDSGEEERGWILSNYRQRRELRPFWAVWQKEEEGKTSAAAGVEVERVAHCPRYKTQRGTGGVGFSRDSATFIYYWGWYQAQESYSPPLDTF